MPWGTRFLVVGGGEVNFSEVGAKIQDTGANLVPPETQGGNLEEVI